MALSLLHARLLESSHVKYGHGGILALPSISLLKCTILHETVDRQTAGMQSPFFTDLSTTTTSSPSSLPWHTLHPASVVCCQCARAFQRITKYSQVLFCVLRGQKNILSFPSLNSPRPILAVPVQIPFVPLQVNRTKIPV